MPRAELPALLSRIAASLRVGGYLLATFGRSGREGVRTTSSASRCLRDYPDDETVWRRSGWEHEFHSIGKEKPWIAIASKES
jgi:hypothetical protein